MLIKAMLRMRHVTTCPELFPLFKELKNNLGRSNSVLPLIIIVGETGFTADWEWLRVSIVSIFTIRQEFSVFIQTLS